MFARSAAMLVSARKLAMRLYRTEQKKCHPSVLAMTPAQRKKTLDDMFRKLPEVEVSQWKARALALEAGKRNPAPGTGPKRANRAQGAKGAPPLPSAEEITPYEYFAREQRSNPAVASAGTPMEKEAVLLFMYTNLPDKAREALEQRTTEHNNLHRYGKVNPLGTRAVGSSASGTSKPAPKKVKRLGKRALERLAREAKRESKRAAKLMAKEAAEMFKEEDKVAKKKTKKKRRASPYALFVQKQMPTLPDMPFKERMIAIGKRWKTLSESERANWLATHAAAVRTAADTTDVADQQLTKPAEEKSDNDDGASAPASADSPDGVPTTTPAAEGEKSTAPPPPPPPASEETAAAATSITTAGPQTSSEDKPSATVASAVDTAKTAPVTLTPDVSATTEPISPPQSAPPPVAESKETVTANAPAVEAKAATSAAPPTPTPTPPSPSPPPSPPSQDAAPAAQVTPTPAAEPATAKVVDLPASPESPPAPHPSERAPTPSAPAQVAPPPPLQASTTPGPAGVGKKKRIIKKKLIKKRKLSGPHSTSAPNGPAVPSPPSPHPSS